MELLGKPLHTNTDNCKKNNVIKNMRLVYKEAKDRASDISQKKKIKILRDSQGQIRGKIGRFRGKKVQICGKIGRLRGILAEKVQTLKDFQGQILRKIGRFHGKFQGETSPRNNQ